MMTNADYEDPPPTHLRPWTFTRRALGVLAGCLVLFGCPLALAVLPLIWDMLAR